MKTSKKRFPIKRVIMYIFLILLAALLFYPLLWLFCASFKNNVEIFASTNLMPESWSLEGYIKGWSILNGTYTYMKFFINTFILVAPTVAFTLISSILVGYGFARYNFPMKKVLFILVISGLLIPQEILMVPRYMLFRSMNLLDSYSVFYIPAMFATYPFFVYMFIQFFRGIPKELDEAARIDGCSAMGILVRIIMPVSKATIFTATIFQFLWRWNDFYNPLIYLSSMEKYPVSLILRTFLDYTDRIMWNQALAMSMVAMLPPILIFAFFQRYLVEGIATTGIKS